RAGEQARATPRRCAFQRLTPQTNSRLKPGPRPRFAPGRVRRIRRAAPRRRVASTAGQASLVSAWKSLHPGTPGTVSNVLRLNREGSRTGHPQDVRKSRGAWLLPSVTHKPLTIARV